MTYGIFSLRKLCIMFIEPPYWFIPMCVIVVVLIIIISINIEKYLCKLYGKKHLRKLYNVICCTLIFASIIILLVIKYWILKN